MFHSAEWEWDFDFSGKKVAVVGSGCSGRVKYFFTIFFFSKILVLQILTIKKRYKSYLNWPKVAARYTCFKDLQVRFLKNGRTENIHRVVFKYKFIKLPG